MSDMQDEAYTELCAENERLRRLNFEASRLASVEAVKVQELKALLTRAADALEQFDLAKAHLGECPVCRLIDELRKAAQ
jgi:hypothetical protein